MTQWLARLDYDDDRSGFWREATGAIDAGVYPEAVLFHVGSSRDLFDAAEQRAAPRRQHTAVGRFDERIVAMINDVVLHHDRQRFALAYRLLWRARSEPRLASIAADRDIALCREMAKSVHRDKHKMKAFVRFREAEDSGSQQRFVAWFEPEHHILRDVAPFFANRFTGMRWSIVTPRCSAHWDGEALTFGPGGSKSDAPDHDPLEDVWRTYYRSTFNPARVNVKAMTTHMPKKFWRNLPEAQLISPLVRAAASTAERMIAAEPTSPRRPARPTTPIASCGGGIGGESLDSCRRCPLWQRATGAVPGVGPADARLMIVGEQPGDQEDIAGKPFIGPAGQLLSTALARAGIDRESSYVTNAVKHFKYETRGKARLHKTPSRDEIDHCRWWLDQERDLIKPKVALALGVSAVRGLTGRSPTLASLRSNVIRLDTTSVMVATVHPAYLLRLSDPVQKREEWRRFLGDLTLARQTVEAA